jgi:hypothetical protein
MKFFNNSSSSSSPISNNIKGMGVVFFCKDCDKIVSVLPVGRKFVYKCSICKTKNVAFGTDKAVRSYYRVPEEEVVAPGSAAASVKPAVPAQTSGQAAPASAEAKMETVKAESAPANDKEAQVKTPAA